MTPSTRWNTARLLALGAGGVDLGAGLGLVLWPELTLRLMLIEAPGAEALVFVRFVGVFVAAVGFTYLWARRGADRREALRAVFRFTLPFRIGAGTFCAVGVAMGALAPLWLGVTVADYVLVAGQLWLLRGEWEAAA